MFPVVSEIPMPPMKEFIVLMACLNALVALSIDAMLPALSIMAADLQVERENDIQYVIGMIFGGMAIGQIFYGPVADAIGRKRTVLIGLAIYIIGTVISWGASSLPIMLAGRFLQGLGVSAPRIVSMAIIRDRYHGRDMAYIMSLVMGVFIMVPAIAPALGQAVLHVASWREIFLMYIAVSLSCVTWFMLRMPETLAPENRRLFKLPVILSGLKEVMHTRLTLGYTISSGLVFGGLLGYLNSSLQIFHGIFATGDMFAVYFGILALCIGAAFFSNSALVRRHGMRKLTRMALSGLTVASIIFMSATLTGHATLLTFMLFMGVAFFAMGLTFGNMNAMAMEPMGHMAGMAAGFIGAVSSVVSLGLGAVIGQMYDGTLLPIATGFVILAPASLALMRWTEKGH
ncbi:MAG: multidrug effflux MFS transporter [Alphaproteobacteria bacterium]